MSDKRKFSKLLGIRLTPEMYDELQKQAQKNGDMAMATLARKMIAEGLRREGEKGNG